MVVGKAAYYQTTAPWMCRSSRKRYATRFLSKTIANVMEKEFPRGFARQNWLRNCETRPHSWIIFILHRGEWWTGEAITIESTSYQKHAIDQGDKNSLSHDGKKSQVLLARSCTRSSLSVLCITRAFRALLFHMTGNGGMSKICFRYSIRRRI